jgi:hypothetical protein
MTRLTKKLITFKILVYETDYSPLVTAQHIILPPLATVITLEVEILHFIVFRDDNSGRMF